MFDINLHTYVVWQLKDNNEFTYKILQFIDKK